MPDPRRAIILTALPKEYLAVRAHLDNPIEDTHEGSVYELGAFNANDRSWKVAIAEIGRYNENAAVEAERAISHFQPHAVIFVGVAGGLKPNDLVIGDVVAATEIYGYKAGKAKDEFLPAPKVYRSTHAMEQRARSVAHSANWLDRIKGSIVRDPAPNVFVEPIASGPEVVKSTRSATYKFLKSNYSDAIAVEMEGLGFLAAAHANPKVEALVVRGISDLLDRKDEADASGSQLLASQNAAAFAFEILAGLDYGDNEASPSKPTIENIPYHRNRNFTGRSSSLDKLRTALTSGQYTALTQAITGLGGIGKTQLALEYAYRHIEEYGVIWWVMSEDTAVLSQDYAFLAEKLELLKEGEKTGIQIDTARRWLEANAGWLLIFDNAQNPEDLHKYLPRKGSGHVIVTSRNQNWESLAEPLEVLEFERSESIEFLETRTGLKDEKTADALADALGDLPLALEQAGAYIKETGISFEGYLDRIRERRKELLERCKPATYPESIATTWKISVEAACKENAASLDLLNLCAHLAPDLIPRDLLAGSQHLPEPLASTVKDRMAFDLALASLRRYSLINFSVDSFSIHRMVQAVTRDQLNEMEQKNWVGVAVNVMNRIFPPAEGYVSSSEKASAFLPHALAATRYAENLKIAPEATGHLLNEVGSYLKSCGKLLEAKDTHMRALKIAEEIYGSDHHVVAIRSNNLGIDLNELGDLKEASKFLERALKIDEKIYGENNPIVAKRLANLGAILDSLGDSKGAKKLCERALEIYEKAYGPNNPESTLALNNLGMALQKLGDLAGAKNCAEKCLKIDEKVYGHDHPNTAIATTNLGAILEDLGELQGARDCFRKALEIDKNFYGPDHYVVALDMNNLGGVLREMKDPEGARKCFKRALKICQAALGKDHPTTSLIANNLNSVQPRSRLIPDNDKQSL